MANLTNDEMNKLRAIWNQAAAANTMYSQHEPTVADIIERQHVEKVLFLVSLINKLIK